MILTLGKDEKVERATCLLKVVSLITSRGCSCFCVYYTINVQDHVAVVRSLHQLHKRGPSNGHWDSSLFTLAGH